MGFGEASMFAKIGFIVLVIAFILQLLGIALPYWYSYSTNDYDAYGGLFRGCYEGSSSNTKVCSRMKNVKDFWAATQAFELIGFFLVTGALILSVVTLFIKSDMNILKLICWILSFCACGFIIIGIIIYGAEAEGTYAEFSGAFGITIVAGILSLVAGVLLLLDWMGKSM